jgi:hypothetical protein
VLRSTPPKTTAALKASHTTISTIHTVTTSSVSSAFA